MKTKHQTRNLNINEEYLCAVRTKSFADFFLHFQSVLPNVPLTSDPTHSHPSFSGPLLNPDQETVTSLLESSIFANEPSNQKTLLSDYFHVSAEASVLCGHLITRLIELRSDYKSIDGAIGSIQRDGGTCRAVSDLLRARAALTGRPPFSDLDRQEFMRAQERHSSVLRQLRSGKKRVRKRRFLGRAAGVCTAAACGAAFAAAAFLAVHTLAVVLVGPMLLTSILNKKKKTKKGTRRKPRMFGYGTTRGAVERLDVAAKGAYILKRDFDTIGRLVSRIEDEIEHNRAMMEVCLERGEERHCLEVLKEIEKYEYGVGKQAEELEEHVYLCLVTINRARAMVVKEICRNNN